jgi:heme A synthase
VESSTLKTGRLAAFAWAVVAFNLAVILWGAYVRATGSGAGCGSHWPLCNGEVLPAAARGGKTFVEFAHRTTSGMAFLLVVGLAWWVFRAFPKGHAARKGAVLSVVFMIIEALIGAGLVLFRLVADDASVARAFYLSLHLVNTFVLVGVLGLTAWWASGGRALDLKGGGDALRWWLAAALLATLALGVSGAVAALGATLFPESASVEAAGGRMTATAQLMFSLRHYQLHPLLAVTVGAYLSATAAVAKRARPGAWANRFANSVIALVVAQLGVGLLNAALLAPAWLQLTHLLLADLLWLALVLLSAAALARGGEAAEESKRVSLRRAVGATN